MLDFSNGHDWTCLVVATYKTQVRRGLVSATELEESSILERHPQRYWLLGKRTDRVADRTGLPWATFWGDYFKNVRKWTATDVVKQDWDSGHGAHHAERESGNGLVKTGSGGGFRSKSHLK